jgi:hypothetical protein
MIKILTTSFLLSLLSLLIILVLPITISEEGSKVGPSPYRVQIDELSYKTRQGLHPDAPEWRQLEDLRIMNNEWFNSTRRVTLLSEELSAYDFFQKASSKLAPVWVVLWGLCFFFLLRSKALHFSSLFILAFPIILFTVQLFSLLALVCIFISVVGVYLMYMLKKDHVND